MSHLVHYGSGNTGEPYGYGQQNSEPEKVAKKSKFSIFKSDSSKSSKNGKVNASAERTSAMKPVPVNTAHTTKKSPTLQEFNAQNKKFDEDVKNLNQLKATMQQHENNIEQLNQKIAENKAKEKQVQEDIKIVTEVEARLARIQAIKDRANKDRVNT